MSLPARVLGFAREHRMFPNGARVAVAVSGGVDSVVLLHVLHSLRGALGIRLVVATLDHGLRHDGAGDAVFVRELARNLELPFYCGRLKIDKGRGIEDAARRQRLAFLRGIPADLVAMGHHGDDQAETVLLRMLRGAGLHALTAMEPVRHPFVRPLLAETRTSIEDYANEKGLRWREDSSNRSMDHERNRVRHQVIPLMEQVHGGAAGRLRTMADNLRGDAAYLDGVARETLARLTRGTGLVLADLSGLHPALLVRVLQGFVRRGAGITMGHAQVRQAMRLIRQGRPGAYVELGAAWRLAVGDTLLHLLPPLPGTMVLGPGSRLSWGAYLVVFETVFSKKSEPHMGLEWERRSMSVELRPAGVGEKVEGRKLTELLRVRGIPAPLRPYHPIIRCGDGLGWIPLVGLFSKDGRRISRPTTGRLGLRLSISSFAGTGCHGAQWCITL